MEHEEAALLLGVYAVHALDDDENRQVVADFEVCVRCRVEASRYADVLFLLGDPDSAAD